MIEPNVPPGHVRVLIERPFDSDLVAAARAVLDGDDPVDPMRAYLDGRKHFADFKIDKTFGAIPIGEGVADDASRDREAILDPTKSKKFLLRAFIAPGSERRIVDPEGGAIHSDPPISSFLTIPPPTCGDTPHVGTAATVRHNLKTHELAQNGLDGKGVALAIVDSGIFLPRITRPLGAMKPLAGAPPSIDPANSWKWNVATEPFYHRLGHGTMCAYDALIAAPKAILLDIAMLLARPIADHTTAGTVGAAIKAYLHLLNRWASGQINASALVVSNSWGIYHPSLEVFPPGDPRRFIDNPNHIFRLFVQLLTQAGADIVFCGANCGTQCASGTCLSKTDRMIMAANTYPEVLTIGGCDTHDDIVGYSSRGPSIAGMYQQKPDLAAYTHFLGSKARRIWIPDTGVSAACPVAAGCVAALRTRVGPAQVPPAQLFDVLKSTARTGNGGYGPGGVWNSTFGYGIIDPVAAGRRLNIIP
jgi:hypothetical protein